MIKHFLTSLAAALLLTNPAFAGETVKTGSDGLHIQSWFHDSPGDMRLDLLAATADSKDLIVLVEQNGCYYCGLLHANNFANPEVVALINDNFLVVQLDLWGDGIVTGFDGIKVTEADLVRKWGVSTTPTTVVFNAANPSVTSFKQAEIFRLPGYLETFEYFSVLDYFASGAFETLGIRAFISAKKDEFTARGIDPKSW